MTDTPGAFSPLGEDGTNAVIEGALTTFAAAGTLAELKEIHLVHIDDASPLTLANRFIGILDRVDKLTAGKLLGGAHGHVTEALTARQETLEAATEEEMLHTETVDITIPTSYTQAGARYPFDVLIDEVCDLFTSMDWSIAEGPEVEHEWLDFNALNFDADHPARQMQDTFYTDSVSVGAAEGQAANLVLHTHTSPVQARVILEQQLPLYVTCPGKVFRSDEPNATHTPVFRQAESLAVDKGPTMVHLRGVLDHFAEAMFGPEARTRLRLSFFPFAEPSAEMDLWFPRKKDGASWIEWGGCGIVNPDVLTACDIGPEVYTGFAFDMGLKRTLMLRRGIADMHDIVEGDIHFP